MPTKRDKANASLHGDGAAGRVTIRRSRPDRGGLFLFGRRYASEDLILTDTDLRALGRGRVVAVENENECISFYRFATDGEGNRR
jgi:hypothetical protein